MKVTGYICCALVFTCLVKIGDAERSRDKFERDFLDEFTPEDMLKVKRPFCNAFTGCGRKRSFYGSPRDTVAAEDLRLPVSLYRTLLKAAARNSIEADDYRVPEVPGKVPLRERLES